MRRKAKVKLEATIGRRGDSNKKGIERVSRKGQTQNKIIHKNHGSHVTGRSFEFTATLPLVKKNSAAGRHSSLLHRGCSGEH
jgi:hypothetical protein